MSINFFESYYRMKHKRLIFFCLRMNDNVQLQQQVCKTYFEPLSQELSAG